MSQRVTAPQSRLSYLAAATHSHENSGSSNATVRSTRSDPQSASITRDITVDEARWLITTVNVTLRLLEGLQFETPEAQNYQIRGLATLHRIAERLPQRFSGYYP